MAFARYQQVFDPVDYLKLIQAYRIFLFLFG